MPARKVFFFATVLYALCFALLFTGVAQLTGIRPRQTVTRGPGDGLSMQGGKLYRAGKPYSGIVLERDGAGTLRSRASFARGKLHGESAEYYASGKIRWKRYYHHGMKHGVHTGWWENGHKMFEYGFRRDASDGPSREWYPDGKRAKELHYADGKEVGMQRAWHENGTLYANYEARDGRQYGVVNARLCYSVKDGAGVFRAPE